MATLSSDILPTLTILWVFTCAAMIIMILRLIMRKLRKQRFEASDYVTMACMFFLLARSALDHVVIRWGTNDVTEAFRASYVFTADDIYEREVGSKLVVINRLIYNSYIWLQKAVVMCLYKRLLSSVRWADVTMRFNWAILAATYVVIQVVTVTECHPIHLYWQVVPDPGVCIKALLQLFVLGALNILTDIILITLPMPVLVKLRLSLVRRIQLVLLFSVGILLVVVTIVRLPQNYANITTQISRITWGSVETLAAAFAANVPTIYSLRPRTAPPRNLINDQGIDLKPATPLNQHDKQKSRKVVVRVREDGGHVCDLPVAPELEV